MGLTDGLSDVGRGIGRGLGTDLLAPVRDIGEYIRSQRTAAQISLRGLAERAGVSNPYLSQIERGLRNPSAAILTQIADGLSISAESLLTKAGILRPHAEVPASEFAAEPGAGEDVESGRSPGIVAAIHADAALTERQKASLIEIYRAFVGSDAADHVDARTE